MRLFLVLYMTYHRLILLLVTALVVVVEVVVVAVAVMILFFFHAYFIFIFIFILFYFDILRRMGKNNTWQTLSSRTSTYQIRTCHPSI